MLINKLYFQAHTPAFCGAVLDSVSFEVKGSKDFSKLYAGIAILGYVAAVQEPINMRAFSQLLNFLGHRYPKVIFLYIRQYEIHYFASFFLHNCNHMHNRQALFPQLRVCLFVLIL